MGRRPFRHFYRGPGDSRQPLLVPERMVRPADIRMAGYKRGETDFESTLERCQSGFAGRTAKARTGRKQNRKSTSGMVRPSSGNHIGGDARNDGTGVPVTIRPTTRKSRIIINPGMPHGSKASMTSSHIGERTMTICEKNRNFLRMLSMHRHFLRK